MLLLTSTSDKIQVTTDSNADVEVWASWVDNNAGTITPGRSANAGITTPSTATIVAAPAASTQRAVKSINIKNEDAANGTGCVVTIDDGTNVVTLANLFLNPKDTVVIDENGNIRQHLLGSDYDDEAYLATRSDMANGTIEAPFAPIRQIWHPAAVKFWVKAGVAGNVIAAYNLTGLSDTGTGAITIVPGISFTSANWCSVFSVEWTATTYAVANQRFVNVGAGSTNAGWVALQCTDGTSTTSVVKDPTTWHCVGFGVIQV